MRLNRVESFYAFLLHFYIELKGTTGHNQALCKGSHSQAPTGATRSDQLHAACPQDVVLAGGQAVGAAPTASPQRGGAHRGVACGHDASPPTLEVPPKGSGACRRGGRQRRAALSPAQGQ
ncbi:hypothetical protein BHM03_00047759 [Ensete ventricosum]|nr:hypothetical protein BHM03_00047759 [Ensete ventricosum]